MIQPLALEERQVEFIGDQPRCDVRGKLWVTFYRRQPAGPSPFIRHRVRVADTEGEMGVMIEEKRRDVIVEYKE